MSAEAATQISADQIGERLPQGRFRMSGDCVSYPEIVGRHM
jgi:hypothetical protein